MADQEGLNFKHWLSRTVMTAIILFVIVYLIDKNTEFDIFRDAILACTIVLIIGFSHEVLHYRQAISLKYKPVWYRTTFKMGFEIVPHANRKKWLKDKKKIGNAPYYVLIPISIVLLVAGVYYSYMALWIAGVASLLMHGISFPSEGKET